MIVPVIILQFMMGTGVSPNYLKNYVEHYKNTHILSLQLAVDFLFNIKIRIQVVTEDLLLTMKVISKMVLYI